jgi:hypothetical protein
MVNLLAITSFYLFGCLSKPQDVAVADITCCEPSRRACVFRAPGLSQVLAIA